MEIEALYERLKDVQCPEYIICNGETLPFDVDAMTYEQYLSCIQVLQSDADDLEKLSGLLGVFFEVKDYTAYDADNIKDFFLSIEKYITRYEIRAKNELKEPDKIPERAAAMHFADAEVGSLQGLGHWLIVDSIAVRMHITHDEVMKMRYSTVFNILKVETYKAWVEWYELKTMKEKMRNK